MTLALTKLRSSSRPWKPSSLRRAGRGPRGQDVHRGHQQVLRAVSGREQQQRRQQALHEAVERQMKQGETTFIEVLLNQELGEPFRRDAMKKPVKVAGINREDMRPQQVS